MSFAIALTDVQWELVADLFDPPGRRGAPAQIPRRQMVEAILFLARTGCQWRYLPERYGSWTAVWAQWRRWRANGVWARAMMRLTAVVRLLHDRKPIPSMVMVDAQTVKGGRYGPTFHEAGGRGGRTIGTKRTLLVEILGLPLASSCATAWPTSRACGRSSATEPTAVSPGSPSASTSDSTSTRRHRARAALSQSGRSTGSSTRSPSWAAGDDCRAATRAPPRALGPGWKSPASATWPGGRWSDRSGRTNSGPVLLSHGRLVSDRSRAALRPAFEPRLPMPTPALGVNHPTPRPRINRRGEFGYRPLVKTESHADGTTEMTGTLGRVDLSCGRLSIWAGDAEPSGPAPGSSPGNPSDCTP